MAIPLLWGLSKAAVSNKEKEEEQKKQELLEMLTMVGKGFAPYEPEITRMQTAEEFMGPPQQIGAGKMRGTPLEGMNRGTPLQGTGIAPKIGMPPERRVGVGGREIADMAAMPLKMPQASLKSPEMGAIPEDVIKMPEKVAGSRFWRKPADEEVSEAARAALAEKLGIEASGVDTKGRTIYQKPSVITPYQQATLTLKEKALLKKQEEEQQKETFTTNDAKLTAALNEVMADYDKRNAEREFNIEDRDEAIAMIKKLSEKINSLDVSKSQKAKLNAKVKKVKTYLSKGLGLKIYGEIPQKGWISKSPASTVEGFPVGD